MLNRAMFQSCRRTARCLSQQLRSSLSAFAGTIAACLKQSTIVVGFSIWMSSVTVKAEVPYSTAYFIGDLGGIPVKIYGHGSAVAKYDNSLINTGESNSALDSSRNYSTKINTVEFVSKHPEMGVVLAQERPFDPSEFDQFETKWMTVLILSGSKFPGPGFMETEFLSNGETKSGDWWNNYEKIPSKKFKLTQYLLNGVNPKTGQQVREGRENDVVYIFRDSNEKVRARIDCYENLLGPIKCTHKWSMEYEGMAAQVLVFYRLEFLREWSQIQRRLTQLILDFRADPSSVPEVPTNDTEAATPQIK